MNGIFDDHLIANGPWQEFERNTARLLFHAGWKHPQIVGRSGDGGADVVAVDNKDNLWVFQCKYSRSIAPNEGVIEEVKRAGKLYGADRLCVVTSRKPTKGFTEELKRLQKQKYPIIHYGPELLIQIAEQVKDDPPTRVKLRDYQITAVEKMREALLDTNRSLLVMATGLGKTVCMAELVVDLLNDALLGDGRILVLAHTNPLINQLLMQFWRHLPKTIATHRFADGERPTSQEGITFATYQTLVNVNEPPYFDMVIIDEAHHLGSPTYTKLLEKLSPPKIVGVTATPWRADGVSIFRWVGKPVFAMGIKEGLTDGYLATVDYRIMTDGLDWSFIKRQSMFGYTIAELNKQLFIPTRDEEATKEIVKAFKDGGCSRCLVFSPSQAHARQFASVARRFGFRAASLTSNDDRITRFRNIAQFAAGKLNLLCVVDIFNEGIDVPDVDLIVFMRVTHSRRIFIQQLGRGLRLSPTKDRVTVLDFAADIRRVHAALDLVTPENNAEIEHLAVSHAHITFSDRSVGSFFYEWIADVGNIQDYDDEDVVRLPALDPDQMNFPSSSDDWSL